VRRVAADVDVGDRRVVPRFPFATRVIQRKDEARLEAFARRVK